MSASIRSFIEFPNAEEEGANIPYINMTNQNFAVLKQSRMINSNALNINSLLGLKRNTK
jgi:hypothetical protein